MSAPDPISDTGGVEQLEELFTAYLTGGDDRALDAVLDVDSGRLSGMDDPATAFRAYGVLGTAWSYAYDSSGDLAALNRAAADLRAAVNSLPPDEASASPWAPTTRVQSLLVTLCDVLRQLGESGQDVLDKAVATGQRAVALASGSSAADINLALALWTRFDRCEDEADLRQAITLLRQVVAAGDEHLTAVSPPPTSAGHCVPAIATPVISRISPTPSPRSGWPTRRHDRTPMPR